MITIVAKGVCRALQQKGSEVPEWDQMIVGSYISLGGDYADTVYIIRPLIWYFVIPACIDREALCQNHHPVSQTFTLLSDDL